MKKIYWLSEIRKEVTRLFVREKNKNWKAWNKIKHKLFTNMHSFSKDIVACPFPLEIF